MSKRINEEDRRAIINRTIKVLPNNPSAAGYSAEIIKKHIYQAIAGADEYDSDVNIVQLINACLDDVEVGQQNYADGKVEALNNAILERLSAKQDKVDNGLGTSDKTIIGAVNEVNEKANYNKVEIESNDSDISDLQSRVGTLERTTTAAETPIGRMIGSALPTSEQLNAFVVEKKGRASKANDTIIFILEIANETDKNYKYINSGEEWSSYEIPPIEVASNGTLGLVKGTYSVDGTSDILVDIVSGCITNIYYKNSEGEYVNLRTKINLIDESLKGIINGTQNVGVSTKAINDASGNEIEKTYAKTSNVYTKGESDNRFLPSTYTNIYYYSQNGLVDDVPTTPANGIQFTKTINTIGETDFFECETELKAVYNFNKNSLDSSELWLSASRDCVIGLKLITFVVDKVTSFHTTLSTDLSGDIELKANTPKKVVIDSVYSDLAEKEIKTDIGDYYYKYLTIITKESEALTLDLYSNNIYPSTFRLNAQSKNLGGVMVNGEFAVVEFTSEPQAQIDNKVDKVEGKGLSTNDYTNEDKALVGTIQDVQEVEEVDVDTIPVENSQNLITSGGVYSQIGNLTNLGTTDKSSLVNAINEVNSGAGGGAELLWSGEKKLQMSGNVSIGLSKNYTGCSKLIMTFKIQRSNTYVDVMFDLLSRESYQKYKIPFQVREEYDSNYYDYVGSISFGSNSSNELRELNSLVGVYNVSSSMERGTFLSRSNENIYQIYLIRVYGIK